jgi:hypothetical protein
MVGRDAAPLMFNVVLARPIPRCPRAPGSALKAETSKRTPAWGFYFGIRKQVSRPAQPYCGGLAVSRYIVGMCGRATYKLTWEEIVALYQLTLFQPAVNTRARFNVCPTTTMTPYSTKTATAGLSECGGALSRLGGRSLKEMKLATFNARAETVATKPMFRSAFKRNRCLILVSGYFEWQTAAGVHSARWLAGADDRRHLG